MAIRWQSDGNQMAIKCKPDGDRMAIRWRSDGNQMAIGWQSDGDQMAVGAYRVDHPRVSQLLEYEVVEELVRRLLIV